MNHIFISYSRRDQGEVTAFVEELRKLGFEVWQDITGGRSGIPYSVKWFEAIEEAVLTAACAIIFRTDAWENSAPCRKEYGLIQDARISYIYVDMEKLQTIRQEIVREVVEWCRVQIKEKDNGCCQWMLSGAYRLYKGVPLDSCYLKGGSFFRNWNWLRRCYKISAQKEFQGAWVSSLELFLKQAKKKVFFRAGYRLFVVICVLVALTFGLAYLEATAMIKILNTTAAAEADMENSARWIGNYDPVLAMVNMVEYGMSAENGIKELRNDEIDYRIKAHTKLMADAVSQGFYTSQAGLLADLVSRNYPIAFYETKLDCPIDIFVMPEEKTSSRYAVTLSEKTAQIFIFDKEKGITRQLLLDAVPADYCLKEEENLLLVAAKNKVYLYDLYGEADPVLLSYNFEDISRLFLFDNKIYALTETEHVLVWNNPLQERKISDGEKLLLGKLAQSKNGQIKAVYIKNDFLILNEDNQETIYQIPFKGTINETEIAVSSDCEYVAVAYRPESSENDVIGVVDLSNGMLVSEYDTECSVEGFVFSEDGSSLLVTCYDKNAIERINLESGEIEESAGKTLERPYTILEYENRFFVSDIGGILTTFDSNLNQVGDYRALGFPVPIKQLVVSSSHDSLLTAGRGGNVIGGSYVTQIFTDKQTVLLPAEGVSVTSNTALAVTDDGEYVAYGNPDGSIYLWDIGTMSQVWNITGIPESIISMVFSKDATILYVLGDSGTVYPMNIEDVMSEIIPGDEKSVWHMLTDRVVVIAQEMCDFGLAE